jgi:hypothetical protein
MKYLAVNNQVDTWIEFKNSRFVAIDITTKIRQQISC